MDHQPVSKPLCKPLHLQVITAIVIGVLRRRFRPETGAFGAIARFHGFALWKFIKYIKKVLPIVLGTSSSESLLPRMRAKLENPGAKKSVVGLLVPSGFSFNLDGSSIDLTMAALFIARAASNTPMTLTQQLTLPPVLQQLLQPPLTPKGAAGVTGSGFTALAATPSAVGHVPVAGPTPTLGIDGFMSEARALTHLIGHGVATVVTVVVAVVVATWTRDRDVERMQPHLDNRSAVEANEPEVALGATEAQMPAGRAR